MQWIIELNLKIIKKKYYRLLFQFESRYLNIHAVREIRRKKIRKLIKPKKSNIKISL